MISISETKALYFGGDGLSDKSCYIYDDNKQQFEPTGRTVHHIESTHAGKIRLSSGREVVIAAGNAESLEAEIYDIKDGTWSAPTSYELPHQILFASTFTVGNRLVFTIYKLIKSGSPRKLRVFSSSHYL